MADQSIFIIAGKQGVGKTTLLKEVLDLLQEKGKSVAGFLAEGKGENNKRSAFTLINVKSGQSIPLCSDFEQETWMKIGRFYFNPTAIKIGEEWLHESITTHADFVVIDEMGRFELEDKVWHPVFRRLQKKQSSPVIITVRDRFLDRIIEKYNLKNAVIFNVSSPAVDIVERIVKSS